MGKASIRRLMRGVIADAIGDREEFLDANRPRFGEPIPEAAEAIARPRAQIARYRELEARIGDPAPLSDADRDTLALACQHARIWRAGLLDSWRGTGDKANIKECRDDIARLERVERHLGVVPDFIVGGPTPEGVRSVSIFELMKTLPVTEMNWPTGPAEAA